MHRGNLIAFCGIDGSGKSTQEDMLADWMRAQELDILQTRQPTDQYRLNPQVRNYMYDEESPIGMEEMALMAAADRQFHLRTVIRPALDRGTSVLSNRYVYSSYAFFMARGLSLAFVKQINPKVPVPDLTVLVDLPAKIARDRVSARDGSIVKSEEKKLDFMETVRQNFLSVADSSFLILDGLEPAEACHAKVVDRLGALLVASEG